MHGRIKRPEEALSLCTQFVEFRLAPHSKYVRGLSFRISSLTPPDSFFLEGSFGPKCFF